jgi:hypothetical protein
MANSYTVTQYLLDRANIHDTVCKLVSTIKHQKLKSKQSTKTPHKTLYYDENNPSGLASEVYAHELTLDYSALTGNPATVLTGEACATSVSKIIAKYDSTQHLNSNIVIDLPQPGAARQRPDTASVKAQVNAHMVKRAARGGPLMQNGGLVHYELARIPELEEKGVNPWRVTKHQVAMIGWENGNQAVHGEGFALMKEELKVK